MIDNYGRNIHYLRLSVTDRCNYRCIYCMNEDGVSKRHHAEILSIEELFEIAAAAHALGIDKIRLTGGEPLVRKGILTLIRLIRSLDPAIDLSLTTNGSMLADTAADLRAAGLDRLNISLDSLDPATFRAVTRRGEVNDVLIGIGAALRAGFNDIKINTVLLGGINDAGAGELIGMTKENDISVRFIELMPIGIVSGWDRGRFVSCDVIRKYLNNAEELSYDGVARIYRLPGHKGTVGLISPMSRRFCDRCDRIRVTADGKLKPCLHSDTEIPLRGLHGEELLDAIRRGIYAKPARHELDEHDSASSRNMNEIGG